MKTTVTGIILEKELERQMKKGGEGRKKVSLWSDSQRKILFFFPLLIVNLLSLLEYVSEQFNSFIRAIVISLFFVSILDLRPSVFSVI